MSIQDKFNRANVIYKITKDIDLGGETLTIPEGCTLDFQGGSFSNGTIAGMNTRISGVLTYSIFNDCILKGLNVEYYDVRWFGAVSDYNNGEGTDNSIYFDRAIKACGYNRGAYVKVIGKFLISSTVTVQYDLNLIGEHQSHRTFWKEEGVEEESRNSLIYVSDNVTAFKVVGRGLETRKSANISISNLRLIGAGSNGNSVFIEFTATGAPPRVGKFAECTCSGFNKVLYFHDLGEFAEGTIYGNLTIEKVIAYGNSQFIVVKASARLVPTLCNLSIRDSNIEQNGEHSIYLENIFGANIIDNNILEGSPNPIYALITNGSLVITNNYFEKNGGSELVHVEGENIKNCLVTCNNNYNVSNSDLIFYFNFITLVDFNNVNQSKTLYLKSCYVINDLYSLCRSEMFDSYSIFSQIIYGKDSPYLENQHRLKFGSDSIRKGLKGINGHTGSKRFSNIQVAVEEGDTIYLVFYTNGVSFTVGLYDSSGSSINDVTSIASLDGVKVVKLNIKKSASQIAVVINSNSAIDISNGFLYKNLEGGVLSRIGIEAPWFSGAEV